VACDGDRFTFYVNGEKLGTYTDNAFAAGDVGLAAGKFEEAGDVHISFDNLKVWGGE